MAASVDSSSESSGSGAVLEKHKKCKKGNTSKKDKKDRKELKKQKKQSAKKEQKRAERAKFWKYNEDEAVRLTQSLFELEPTVASDLRAVFQRIDQGEVVQIDGLENKHVKKKLRHLFQAMRLAPAENQGFRSADPKVLFVAVLDSCMQKTCFSKPLRNADNAAPKQPAADAPAEVMKIMPPLAAPDAKEAQGLLGAEPIRPVSKARVKGPQLPGASVGPGAQSDEESDDGNGGPKIDGEEREGVDLRALPVQSRREDWMTKPHESIAAAFGERACGPKDAFEVKRSPEEQKAWEAQMKRGPSLLEQSKDGQFDASGAWENVQQMHKKQKASQEAWGMSANEQERSVANDRTPHTSRRPFDPEQDMKQVKPMTGDQFTSLVQNSGVALTGRFSRGNFATSFL